MPLFIVETITTFRHFYAVEARTEADAEEVVRVLPDDLEELDQKYLGELITCSREVTSDEFRRLAKDATNGHIAEDIIYIAKYREAERPDFSANIDGLGV